MQQTKLNSDGFHWANLPKLAAAAIILAASFSASAVAQQAGQKTFSSAQEAAQALASAAQNNDDKAMLAILGPSGKTLVSSGDETEDADSRANFAKRYQEMHRLVREPDGTTVLYIGAHNWPSPIPLMHKGNTWYFDTEAGKKEILYRRIGRNELSAIRICEELVSAQKDYAGQHGGEFAKKIFSDEGKQDGLYWKAANGEPQSPIGPLVADAVATGYAKSQNGEPTPYRGYYFHVLTGEEKSGFAFIAYPAEYRSSGVMTFIVNQDGVVYEKDLGRKTETAADSMRKYSTAGWRKAEEGQTQETAEGGAPATK
ncbi:MAG: DUF2950 family protein [Terriglobales bacterium]